MAFWRAITALVDGTAVALRNDNFVMGEDNIVISLYTAYLYWLIICI